MYRRWPFIIGGILGLGFVALISSAQAVVPRTTLHSGDQNKDVWNLQSTLHDQGLLSGPVTGTYDADTADAVAQLQSDAGIEPTGEYTDETSDALAELVHPDVDDTQTFVENTDIDTPIISNPISVIGESITEAVANVVKKITPKPTTTSTEADPPKTASPAVILPDCTDSQVRIYRDISTLRLVVSGTSKMIAIGQIRIANYSECELQITATRIYPLYSNQFDGDRFPFTTIDIIDAQASTVVGSAPVQSVSGVTRIAPDLLAKLVIAPNTTNGFLLRLSRPTTTVLAGAIGFGIGDISYTFKGAQKTDTFVDRKIMWSNLFEIPQ